MHVVTDEEALSPGYTFKHCYKTFQVKDDPRSYERNLMQLRKEA